MTFLNCIGKRIGISYMCMYMHMYMYMCMYMLYMYMCMYMSCHTQHTHVGVSRHATSHQKYFRFHRMI